MSVGDVDMFIQKSATGGSNKTLKMADLNPAPQRKVEDLCCYYITPNKNTNAKMHMLSQFRKAGLSNIKHVSAFEFPRFANPKLKRDLLTRGHIKMWKEAYKNGDDGALFFEDDVYFLKDFKKVCNHILNLENTPDIIRFDNTPFISIENQEEDTIHICRQLYGYVSAGGYYLSKDAILAALTYTKFNPWNWFSIETLLRKINDEYLLMNNYTTFPKLCVQDWFNLNATTVQNRQHEEIRLRKTAYYYKQYARRYHFSGEELEKINRNYENSTYVPIDLATHNISIL